MSRLAGSLLVVLLSGPTTVANPPWMSLLSPVPIQHVVRVVTAAAPRTITAAPPTVLGTTARVIGAGTLGLRVHTQPSQDAPIIGTLDEGTTVTVLAGPVHFAGAPWWRISGPIGTGWVRGDRLKG